MAIKLNYKNILFVTGGTGGHIFPALSTYYLIKNLSTNIFFATDPRGLQNSELLKLRPYLMNIVGFEGKNIFFKAYSMFLLFIGIFKAIIFLKKKNIKIVLGFGSYVQVPFICAALILKCEIILHEANAVMGRANKLFWKYVKYRTSAFNLGANFKDTINIGMPVRKEILNLYKKNYNPPSKTGNINLLILGGSLGSTALSYNICKCLVHLPIKIKKRLNIMHQVKLSEMAKVKNEYMKSNIKHNVVTFINDISYFLGRATLVISRAGSSTVAENAIVGVPAVYFPLPKSIGNHQYLNALHYKNKKAAWILDEKSITSGAFLLFLKEILLDKKSLVKTSINSKKISNPKAGRKLSELILGLTIANV